MGIDSSKLSYDINKEKSKTYNSCSNKYLGGNKLSIQRRDSLDCDLTENHKKNTYLNKSHEFNEKNHKCYKDQNCNSNQININELNQCKVSSKVNDSPKNNNSKYKNQEKLENQMQNINILSSKKNEMREITQFENCSTNITSNYSKCVDKPEIPVQPIIESDKTNEVSRYQLKPAKEEKTKNIKFNEKITCFRIINENTNSNIMNQTINGTCKTSPLSLTKVKIEWIEGGNDVFLAGSYNNWELTKLVYNSTTGTHFCELVSLNILNIYYFSN